MEKRQPKKVVIIGGGPAGLTAAYQLAKAGEKAIVLEKEPTVGGISKTVNYKNYYFDIGGHRFFTKVESVDRIWKEVLQDDFLRCRRLSRIYYNEKFFYYPLRPLNALFGLGAWNSILILFSFLHAQVWPTKEENTLEHWVSNRFGKRLYNTFFKSYTEKVWGVSCSEIRAEWAAQRIKGLSLLSALKNALLPKNTGRGKKEVIKTLIDEFDYPKYGPGMMWQRMADIVQEKGSQLWLNSSVESILWSKHRVEALEVKKDGGESIWVHGTDFISSMPIQEAIQKFTPPVPEEVLTAAEKLKYRDFLTVALVVDKKSVFADNWIYIHDPGVLVGRIQNFKNWSPYMVPDPEKTCLGLEYFCFEGDHLWSMDDEELIRLGKEELEKLGLVKANEIEDGAVVRMPKAYPIYDSAYTESLNVIRRFLSGVDNLQAVGRNGMHKYNNQDHSMLTSMLAVENIFNAKHDLWGVNAEQSYHEEMKIMTGTGDRQSEADQMILRTFAKMDKLALATAVGIVTGLGICIATLWLLISGGGSLTTYVELLDQFFIGYSVSVKGAFVGLIYGFIWGFLFGWLFAYLRNLILAFYIYQIRKRVEFLVFRDFLDHF